MIVSGAENSVSGLVTGIRGLRYSFPKFWRRDWQVACKFSEICRDIYQSLNTEMKGVLKVGRKQLFHCLCIYSYRVIPATIGLDAHIILYYGPGKASSPTIAMIPFRRCAIPTPCYMRTLKSSRPILLVFIPGSHVVHYYQSEYIREVSIFTSPFSPDLSEASRSTPLLARTVQGEWGGRVIPPRR